MKATQAIKMSANAQAIRTLAKVGSVLILVLGVLYCEIMYLSVVEKAFPDGFLRVFAAAGAVVGGLSVLLLLLSKSYWFTEGMQLVWSYIFTGLEVLALVANVILAFEINGGQVDQWLQVWKSFSPATPVIAIVGWTIVWALDASAKRRHAQTNMEDGQHEANLEFSGKVHGAVMEVKELYLGQTVQFLRDEFNSHDVQNNLRKVAVEIHHDVLKEFTATPLNPGQETRQINSSASVEDKIIDAGAGSGAKKLEPVSLPQTAMAAVPPASVPASAQVARQQLAARHIQARRSRKMLNASKVATAPTPVLQAAASSGNGVAQPKKASSPVRRAKRGASTQTKP